MLRCNDLVVTEGRASSSVARRQLGRRLRRLREAASKNLADVELADIASRSKMWKIETGRIAVKPGDVLLLARLYGVDAATTDELELLARSTRASGFQEEYGASVPEWVGLYADLEAGASTVRDYNCELVHGLLQTADYARAVTEASGSLSPAVVDQRVAFRMERQRAFFDRPRPGALDAVVTAGALSITVGSSTVMEEQIAHLRAVSNRDGVSVSVLPFSNGVHAAMKGPYTILDFDDPEDPSLVYVESLIGSRYIERPVHVLQFRGAFDEMRAQTVPLKEHLGE